jgi:hypothetical protein
MTDEVVIQAAEKRMSKKLKAFDDAFNKAQRGS